MEREIDTIIHLTNYLKSHGYSEDNIILEWKITDNIRVDMAIIDSVSKKPIALFEFKRRKNKESENLAKQQLKKYAQTVGDSTIPLYVVYSIDQEPYFELFFLTEQNGVEILKPIYQVPTFTSFKNSSISKQIIQVEKEKKNTYDLFKIICWLLAAIIIGLLYLDFKECIKLTPERLGIIAIISGLIIVPFARKLNILGVEFERLYEERTEKK